MRTLWLSAVLLLLTFGFSPEALAQEGQAESEVTRTTYKRKTIIDFSDVTIQGELTKPAGSYLLNRRKTKFRLLLEVRTDFLPELFNSTDNL